MSRRKLWIVWSSAGVGFVLLGLTGLGVYFSRRFEPFLREQTIAYLEDRFDADVELAVLKVRMPLASPMEILARRGKGAMARISGERITFKLKSMPDRPTFMTMRKFSFEVDLNSAFEKKALVRKVRLEGLELKMPPKGEKPPAAHAAHASAPQVAVHIDEIVADGTRLSIIPRDPARDPLVFEIAKLRLESVGNGEPMRYTAVLTNAKPPGLIHATGSFGPWNAESPSATPLSGQYDFRNADLSVFKGIAGKLAATGQFHGELGRFESDGEARVPDFQLTMSGNPIPLATKYHAIVDGTNGNTILDPVEAKLGQSTFDVKGAIARYAGEKGKTVDLDAIFRNGRLDDVLLLAVKGPKPILRGGLGLHVKILLPPGKGEVADRLKLNGNFRLIEARFTNPRIQEELDILSRRAQGQPHNEEVDEVPWRMDGVFHMSGGRVAFEKLNFAIDGAKAAMAGSFVFAGQELDFHGTARVDARLSQMMMTRWKRWLLKPVDPIFAKEGYGTVADFKISGTREAPVFGLDRNGSKDKDHDQNAKHATPPQPQAAPARHSAVRAQGLP
ncbi:translocation/assembly module TamB domain-containing protein [Paludibaculum fermentans]|uniref:AsmA-like C-terminal domain-containing protein n=1 Tax=Paludibaculum fermentans TaxID=1473598 RepID=A0A7S7SJ97_PALFE|nr:hypothetical protein [Paludibaculum fermentans]QOY86468.1 hypothetical protein IRI77_27225 [Paludibaculum fermentans]